MKKQVLERIAKLLATNNQDIRRELQGELYHFITSAKLPSATARFLSRGIQTNKNN